MLQQEVATSACFIIISYLALSHSIFIEGIQDLQATYMGDID